ncbi:hypothetical protein [Dactylosporangium salmoneum]|uniref:Uncharacterized protein n=1 Tax=Dactylosporangium salmoneum TaxID=53361 RepID=A0ABN3GIQ1_9ACTN
MVAGPEPLSKAPANGSLIGSTGRIADLSASGVVAAIAGPAALRIAAAVSVPVAFVLGSIGRDCQVTMAAMSSGPLSAGPAGYGAPPTVFAGGTVLGALVHLFSRRPAPAAHRAPPRSAHQPRRASNPLATVGEEVAARPRSQPGRGGRGRRAGRLIHL